MGHTPRQGTLLPECPHLKLFELLVLISLFQLCSGFKQVTKAVKEVALLSCDYNVSPEQLASVRIYWQRGDATVLTVISGQKEVWPEYRNRTTIDLTNNLSIVILALRLSDRGQYTCVVQKLEKGAYKLKHLTSVMLKVTADFPTPSMTEFGTTSSNIRRINCSTSGGFPEPRLSWLEDGKELNAINTTVSQDPETELYAVSSYLDFSATSDHSFVCLVKYGDSTISQTFHWQKYYVTRWRDRRRHVETVEMDTASADV
ncbi:T-lymphocyte activation antigen CD80 isoform X2 [Tupaia chinensis]|uniref:T-lymphocyte activation antigen CD80 isoform X2 n=1 Tax=Tupaia chinensis TaxID=246437 RepID=UPI000FFC6653|nr:T-lymphocyte activation antigen CD80 isoform X2 [Tupaia chinensis]